MVANEDENIIPEGTNIEEDVKETKTASKKAICLEILPAIKEAQQQHGLRHGDYQRYRGYCSRRIRRLRKVLKLPQGDRRHYKRRDVLPTHLETPQADGRFLEITLMQSERAWAYAMQLRQEANTELRKRFHLANRLKKACIHAITLENLAKTEMCDARTKLEAYAYKLWIHGTFQFEVELWKNAAENLTLAQRIYGELADSLPLDEQALYRQRCEELIPSLRYCAYNIDGGDTKKAQALYRQIQAGGIPDILDTLLQQAKEDSTENRNETEWRGVKFAVRPEQVRMFVASIKDLDTKVKNTTDITKRIALLEQLLMNCKESINAVKEDIKTDPKLKGPSGEPLPGSQSLLTFLTYHRSMLTIERNLGLIEQAQTAPDANKKARPQDFARFYEIILQNVNELQALKGFEEDKGYQSEIEVMAKMYKGFRCFYIAKTLESTKKWSEAYALYERSAGYAKSIIDDKFTDAKNKSKVEGLLTDIDTSKFTAHALAVLEEIETEETEDSSKKTLKKPKTKTPLIERLDEYVEDLSMTTKTPNLVKLPPDMKPIPCKPLFFDLADNFIQFPDLQDKIDVKTKKPDQPAGISGFVKGFLSWGKK